MQHATLYELTTPARHFYPAPSKIEGAGNGLFSKALIEPDTLLFIAFAPVGNNKNKEAINQEAKALDANAKPVFEAEYVQLFPNDFVNHSTEPNTETALIGDMLFVRSLREIQPHEELTKDYRKTMSLITTLGYALADDFMNF